MGAGEDFTPGFSFDIGQAEGPAQTPWEFGGGYSKQHHATSCNNIFSRLQSQGPPSKAGRAAATSMLTARAAVAAGLKTKGATGFTCRKNPGRGF